MAKVQLLAILSLDGCLSDVKTEGRWWLRSESYGLDEIRRKATFTLSPDHSLSMLISEREKKDSSVYLIEATNETAKYINGMLQMRVIDEIILYTIPFIAGTGKFLFCRELPISYWKLKKQKMYPDGIICNIYHRIDMEE